MGCFLEKNIYFEVLMKLDFSHEVSTLLMRTDPHTDVQAASCLCMFASWKHAILATDGNVGCFTMNGKKMIESEVNSSVATIFKH